VLGPTAADGGGVWFTTVKWNAAGTYAISVTPRELSPTGGIRSLATYPVDAWFALLLSSFFEPPNVIFFGSAGFRIGDTTNPDAGLADIPYPTNAFALVPDHIYASSADNSAEIVDIDRRTGKRAAFASDQNVQRYIVADESFVYWITDPPSGGSAGELRRQSRAAGGVEPVVEVQNPGGLSVDAEFLYFVSLSSGSAEVRRMSKTGPDVPITLSTLIDPAIVPTMESSLDVDGWVDFGSPKYWSRFTPEPKTGPLFWTIRPKPDPNKGHLVVEVPRCGGDPRRAVFFDDVRTFAGAGSTVYGTNFSALLRGSR
jgi:hypothetical protein